MIAIDTIHASAYMMVFVCLLKWMLAQGAENEERVTIAKKMLLGDFHVQTVDKRFMAILIPKRKPNTAEVDELADEEESAAVAKNGVEAEYEWVRALRYKMEKTAEAEMTAETEEEEERQRFEEQLRYDNICLFFEDDRVGILILFKLDCAKLCRHVHRILSLL